MACLLLETSQGKDELYCFYYLPAVTEQPRCYEALGLQAIKILNMIKLFGKAIRVNKASQDKDTLDVGANLFIGNLDPDVDEKVCSKFMVHLTNSSLHNLRTHCFACPHY